MKTLEITGEIAERIRTHGVQSYPRECCGAMLGRDLDGSPGSQEAQRQIQELIPLVNRQKDSALNRFSVTAEDVREAEKAARLRGLEVLGWYHSHPDSPAKPSEYDREHAWPWYSYVIVSVNAGVAGEITSWRLSDDRTQFLPEAIEIHERATA
jgi:proteasome lid subunit RPN8/RPN11